jgi:MoaA/NifB/PqqE/SkfB family radical SAM enzyme
MTPYNTIYWDIIGLCNSNCLYCCNGGNNVLGQKHREQANVLFPEEFEVALNILSNKGVAIPNQTHIELYNWGEPFLHPQFEDMTRMVTNRGFSLGLSTNASIVKTIPIEVIPKLKSIRFSMPGFSQYSYDKMHGFNFDTICNNIKIITEQIKSVPSNVFISIGFHFYKTNLSEMVEASMFCNKLGIHFFPFYAYLTSFTMMQKFLNNEIDKKDINKIIHTEHLETVRQRRPADYICPQYTGLVLDEFCNVLQCCCTDRETTGHVIGKLQDIDFEKLPKQRCNSSVCSICHSLKLDYMWHNAGVY